MEKKGDIQIEDLYQTYHAGILRYLQRFVSESQAEDLTQEAFVKASNGLKGFRDEASPKTWLYRIATNTLRDYLRSKGHRNDAVCDSITEQELERCGNSVQIETSIEGSAIRTEMNCCIQEFIHKLPENYSAVLVLSDLEGHSNKEIADTLELTPGDVKIRLHRARARLKVELSKGCDFSHNKDNDLECQRKDV